MLLFLGRRIEHSFALDAFERGFEVRRFLVFIATLSLGLVNSASAQECGPGCPVCSGSGSSTAALLPSGTLISSGMFIPEGEDETGVLNLRAGVTPWLDLGFGYTVESKKLIWGVRLQPLAEDESSWRPGIILGSGSVQTGGSDQSIFIQLTKALDFSEEFAARFSVGVAGLLPDMDRGYFLANLTMTVIERWSPFLSYDGRNFHLGLSWILTDTIFIAGYLVEMKTPAVLVGYRWIF